MTSDSAQTAAYGSSSPFTAAEVQIRVSRPKVSPDFFTILGIVLSVVLIGTAISMGSSDANFFDLPSLLIVVLGTITATSISYSSDEMKHVAGILGNTVLRKVWRPSSVARELMDIATLARKRGILVLSGLDLELQKNPHIRRAVSLVADGYTGDDIERVLSQEIDSLVERHRRSANILRRAAEIAPAMGLIGTLVGLVQMLSSLDDPSTIGPAMALALITTFYGAIMGMVILGPLAGKLERNSNGEALIRALVAHAAVSMARQENPRRLEMLLNSELPPDERITYFD